MNIDVYVGIDPGKTGGIAWIDRGDTYAEKLTNMTERDIWMLIEGLNDRPENSANVFAMIEGVRSSPQMGVVSAFTFGRCCGGLRMALIASGIPFEEVAPGTWQRSLKCLSGGNKNVTKRRAQELFPNLKITHAIADALLIAEYNRRKHENGRLP